MPSAPCSGACPPADDCLCASPWTPYATTGTALAAFGTNWAEHTIRFHARHSATDGRLAVFLGGALPADTTLLLHPKQLLKVQSTCLRDSSSPIPARKRNPAFARSYAVPE
jgi:hypothetical protein